MSNDLKATKGPWVNYGGVIRGHPDGNCEDQIAEVEVYDPETYANAHLIAAAPELYDALRAIVETEDDAIFDRLGPDLCEDIDDALAKARGES